MQTGGKHKRTPPGTPLGPGVKVRGVKLCSHCFIVALTRKYGWFEGKRVWWLECPACGRSY